MGDSPRMRWFRVYDEDVLDDPRIGALSATNLGHYIRILAASSRQKRRGLVPSLVDLGFLLRLKKRRDVDRIIKIMLDAGLITEIAPNQYKITDWDEKQFPSDNSTSRWHKHMEAKRANVGANVGRALAQTCPDSELDTETEEEGGDNSRTRACESPPEPPPLCSHSSYTDGCDQCKRRECLKWAGEKWGPKANRYVATKLLREFSADIVMKAMDVLWDKPDNTFVPNFLLKVCGQLQDQGYTLNGSKVSQVDYHVADADMPKNYPNHTQIQEMNGRW